MAADAKQSGNEHVSDQNSHGELMKKHSHFDDDDALLFGGSGTHRKQQFIPTIDSLLVLWFFENPCLSCC